MNILLTNDDGYNSEGILLLKKKLAKYGKVVLFAPYRHMSAKSVSLTLGEGSKLYRISDDTFAFDGTPADCVAFALTQLNIDFDLVVSGCNNGLNVSYDILFSGTVGACAQALIHGKKTIAFSQLGDFPLVDKYFDDVFDFVLKHNLLSNEYMLNVNFPISGDVKDIKLAKQCYQKANLYYLKNDNDEYIAKRVLIPEEYPKDSELYMINHNIVAITPLGRDYFNINIYNKLKKEIDN